jgi:hypothetical protein
MACKELSLFENAFAALSLKTDYGGVHSNGITHMSILAFTDGSYIEFISTVTQKHSPLWNKYISKNGGPCAWAMEVEDINAETRRMKDLGISVRGPSYYNRRRPDGVLIEWDLTFLGDGEPGATLPFLIRDRTKRELRVRPSASLSTEYENGKRLSDLLCGIGYVVLGVDRLGRFAELFRRIYDWNNWKESRIANWGAKIAWSPNSPAILASPDESNWLSNRLAEFGNSPCAFIIATRDMEAAAKRFGLGKPEEWMGYKVAWFDPRKLNGTRLGVTDAPQQRQ